LLKRFHGRVNQLWRAARDFNFADSSVGCDCQLLVTVPSICALLPFPGIQVPLSQPASSRLFSGRGTGVG